MSKKIFALVFSLFYSTWSFALEPYHLENQKTVGFYIKKLGIKMVDATFSHVDSTIRFDENDLTQTQMHFVMDVKSLMLSSDTLKNMLLGEKYFNSNKYKDIVFDSTKIQALGRNKYNVFGNLTIKGKTRPVVFFTTIARNPKTNMQFLKATTQVQLKNFEIKSQLAFADHVDIYVDGNLTH